MEKKTIEENLVIDENGKVYTTGELKDYLGNAEIDIDGIMAENDDLEKGRIKEYQKKQRKRILKNLLKKK